MTERMVRSAMHYWVSVLDETTGGAITRGYREATALERMKEWDGLAAEQIEKLKAVKGEEWVIKQAAEVERLRVEVTPNDK
jgi:hypothetical protein